jgi:ABC-type microcin C transport system permease subunit YejE
VSWEVYLYGFYVALCHYFADIVGLMLYLCRNTVLIVFCLLSVSLGLRNGALCVDLPGRINILLVRFSEVSQLTL